MKRGDLATGATPWIRSRVKSACGVARHIGEAKRKRKPASRLAAGSCRAAAYPIGRGAVSGAASTSPILQWFQSAFRDRPPVWGRKGAYWQTSGLKKQAGSGATGHIDAPAGTCSERETSHCPARFEARPQRSPCRRVPPPVPFFIALPEGAGGAFDFVARTQHHRRLGLNRRSEPVAAVKIGGDGGLAAKRDGLAAGRPEALSAGRGAVPQGADPVVILSRAPLMAGSWGSGARDSNSDCFSQGKRV